MYFTSTIMNVCILVLSSVVVLLALYQLKTKTQIKRTMITFLCLGLISGGLALAAKLENDGIDEMLRLSANILTESYKSNQAKIRELRQENKELKKELKEHEQKQE